LMRDLFPLFAFFFQKKRCTLSKEKIWLEK
jgi:hypothetical protein